MDIFTELQSGLLELEKESDYDGYWYRISDILTIMVCGMLCHLQTIDNIHEWANAAPARAFFAQYFQIERMPCRAQFYNIIASVNAEKFGEIFIKWMHTVLHGDLSGKTVAIDGKTICSTDKLTKDGSVLHIASALISENGLVIGSRECDTKTGEITAFRELVEILDVAGAVVVADALHCSRKSAKIVIKEKADYLFCVKDNQPNLKENIALYVHNEKLETFSKTEKNGGRIEKRTAYVTKEIDWLYGRSEWENLACIGAIHTEFEKGGKKSSEWHYYISSAALDAKSLLKHARLEWRVEAMHWLLDVHFAEDKTMVWSMNVQKTLNIMRKIALNLAKEYKAKTECKMPMSAILKRNLFDVDVLGQFLMTFTEFSAN